MFLLSVSRRWVCGPVLQEWVVPARQQFTGTATKRHHMGAPLRARYPLAVACMCVRTYVHTLQAGTGLVPLLWQQTGYYNLTNGPKRVKQG